MRPAVISVECEGNYTLSVAFDYGENGLLDMKPYLNFGIFINCKIQESSKPFISLLTQLHGNLAPILILSSFTKNAALSNRVSN